MEIIQFHKQIDFLPNDNKYLKWYWNICENAKTRVKPEGYAEKHHIYPKSIYGENADLVMLTAKEHYIVHLCLWQGLRQKYGTGDIRTRKMAYGFTMMNNPGKGNNRHKIQCSTEFSLLRLAAYERQKGVPHSEERKKKISDNHAHLSGEKNGMYGKGDLVSGEKNGMYGKIGANKGISNYDRWLLKYGKEEADKRKEKLSETMKQSWKEEKELGIKRKGSSNFGGDVYLKWISKYGKEEADKRKEISNNNKKLAQQRRHGKL